MTAQEVADELEGREIRIYQLWRGWAQEQALVEIERHVQRGAPDGRHGGRGKPAPPSALRRFGPVAGAVLCIALAIAIQYH